MEARILRKLTYQVERAYFEAFGTTDGTCAEAAALLAALVEGEVVAGAYKIGDDYFKHCWVEKDGYILDPTRSQFEGGSLILRKDHNRNYFDAEWGNRPQPPKRPNLYLAREWLKWVIESYQEVWDKRKVYCQLLQGFGIDLKIEDLEDLSEEVCNRA